MLPNIDIHFSPYLDEIFRAWILSVPKYSGWKVPAADFVLERAAEFRREWEKQGPSLLRQMQELTGLSFIRNYFPIYVVSGNPRAYSNPIVVKSSFSLPEFLSCLTHELIHCLFVDNRDSLFIQNANRLFTNDHVALYAVLGSILPEVLEENLRVDVFPLNKKYAEAISIVKRTGAADILRQCKTQPK